jgi:phage terminase large subunit-like protein
MAQTRQGSLQPVLAGTGTANVIDDLSGRYAPHEWAHRAIEAYHRHKADRIIAEVNHLSLFAMSKLHSALRMATASSAIAGVLRA